MERRSFIKASAGIPALGLVLPGDLKPSIDHQTTEQNIVVFQGDSITDANRDRAHYYANQVRGMGHGYVSQIVAEMLGAEPHKDWQCYNRGISGNKVYQLADRWEIDCLALKPDILSILIGVNDYWHMINGRYAGTPQIYEGDYRALLTRTKAALPGVKLILGEPFAVAGGSAIDDRWKDFDTYREIARQLADEFGAAFIPYHDIFAQALKQAPVAYWCPDGVHPSTAGAHLMKKAWLEAFAAI